MQRVSVVLVCLLVCTCVAALVPAVNLRDDPPWSKPPNNFTVPKATPEQFRLASLYGSDMVLQMAPKSAQIWGWGQPFAEIVLKFNDTIYSTTVYREGTWALRLPPQPGGGPHVITVEHVPLSLCGSQSVELTGVMFGDVWLCSGGSNMAQELNTITHHQEQVNRARTHPNLRLFQIRRQASSSPQLEGGIIREWETTQQEVLLSYFPALCLLYGMEMSDIHPGRAIGLIEAAWGGTPIQAWASDRVFSACHVLAHPPDHVHLPEHIEAPQSHAGEHSRLGHLAHSTPLPIHVGQGVTNFHVKHETSQSVEVDQYADSSLWNGMIFPLTKLALRGVIWHQGEANTAYQSDRYGCLFQNLVTDWQNSFLDADVPVPEEQGMHFPFGYVQLGPSRSERHRAWSNLRLQQSFADPLFNLPGPFLAETFTALAYDLIDNPDELVTGLGAHYRNKVRVADRLAHAARQLMYDTDLDATGPVPLLDQMTVDHDLGVLNITYNKDIQVRGPEGFFFEVVEGEGIAAEIKSSWQRGVSLVLQDNARYVSYGWGALPCEHQRCAIYSTDPINKYGLPAVLFRAYIPIKLLLH